MNLTYRLATIIDAERLGLLAAKAWQAAYPGIISQAQIEYMLGRMYNLETIETQIREGHINWLIMIEGQGNPAEQMGLPDNENWVGYASYGPHPSSADEYRLHKLYLDPAVKGRGYGKLLLQAVVNRLTLGTRQLELNVNKLNPAYSFYLRQGFRVRREEVLDIGEGYVMDDYVMVLDVRP
jgi:ribosomal protein S18 acetylase RimI-like enzyme